MIDYHIRPDCRLCGGTYKEVLQLKDTPLANEFISELEVKSGMKTKFGNQKFPLYLVQCDSCNHVQLPVVVNPQRLFKNYVYASGTSKVFVEHFRQYADYIWKEFNLSGNDLVVDIGSNDGTLLHEFSKLGVRVLGVEPGGEVAKIAEEKEILTVSSFFDQKVAKSILNSLGHAKVVTANNVFAHADDLAGIVEGILTILDRDGIFVFEVQWLADMLINNLFDMIYHEHVAYHHLEPLIKFFDKFGMRIFDVQKQPTHGGSARVFVCRKSAEFVVNRPALEACFVHDLVALGNLAGWEQRINERGVDLRFILNSIKADGKKVVGFGAPAKVTTLMHQFDIGSEWVDYIIDDSPLKQGKYTPGKRIPVVPVSKLYDDMYINGLEPDYCLILAWNFADSIIKNHQEYLNRGGKFIVPLPELRVIS